MAANSLNEVNTPTSTSTPGSSESDEKQPQAHVRYSTTATAVPRPLAQNSSNPIHNPATTTLVPPILQRRATLSSTGGRAKRIFRNRMHSTQPHPTPIDPVISAVEQQQDEGAPAQRGSRIKANPKDILQAACAHEKYTTHLTGFPINTTLPEYDDLNAYPISQDSAKELLEQEIARLVNIVENPEDALRFSGQELLKEGSLDSYNKLSSLSQMIMKAFSICTLDNEVISLKCCKGLTNKEKVARYMRTVSSGQPACAQKEFESESSENLYDWKYTYASYILVDYATAVIVRLVTQSGNGEYWHNNLVGVLAKWTTKVKMLLLDLYNSTSISLRAAGYALDRDSSQPGTKNREEVEDEDGEVCEELKMPLDTNAESFVKWHCVHQERFRSGLVAILRYIFTSLQHLKRSGLSMTSYEVCAVVYETGFEGFKALLFQDRNYEFTATSDLNNLNVAHSAFSILNQTVLDLQVRISQRGPPILGTDGLRTMIEWTYFEKRDGPSPGTRGPENPNLDSSDITTGKQELVLCNMEDIITVMVPLAAASPVISANLNSFRNMVALTGDVDDIVRPYAESTFGAFFRMFTNEFDSTTRRLDVLRLSQAVQSGLFSRSSLIGGTESKSTPTNDQNMVSSRDIQHELNAKQLRQLTAEMDEWVYDESSVIVNCGFYVWSVIITAITLVIGGLAIGFALGTRIEGVDPFNITTYAWVLAAFVILVCKSIYVENWPWRDFLLRRVQCRSVSELQGITGINEQLIMAKLLHDEHWTILNTRGPYNSVFQRKSQDGTGFSIDRPLNTRTLLLSGLTLLKVITPEGHALVCLDARRGTDLKVVEHRGLASKEHLVCEIIRPQLRTSEESRGVQPLKLSLTKSPLRSQSPLRWKGVQGVYNKLDTVFV